MTSCIEIGEGNQKRTKFQVEIDIKDPLMDREAMVKYLRDSPIEGTIWMENLAQIIERG